MAVGVDSVAPFHKFVNVGETLECWAHQPHIYFHFKGDRMYCVNRSWVQGWQYLGNPDEKRLAMCRFSLYPVDLGLIPLLCCFLSTGMHFIRHHVSEGEESSAHGPQLILRCWECLHYTSWRCKFLSDPVWLTLWLWESQPGLELRRKQELHTMWNYDKHVNMDFLS